MTTGRSQAQTPEHGARGAAARTRGLGLTWQRGGFVLGLVVGLLIGLSIALGVALYITKAPIPFINKVPPRTPEQDQAEAERNRQWDPNAPLGGRAAVRGATPPASAASGAAETPPPASPLPPAPSTSTAPERNPAAILAGESSTTPAAPASAAAPAAPVFFVQVGAFANLSEAEQQRARVAMTGMTARLNEREQAGRTVYRVRLGPFDRRDEAEAVQTRLTGQGFEARLVRAERP